MLKTLWRSLANLTWLVYEHVAMVFGFTLLASLCLLALPFAFVVFLMPARLSQPLVRTAITFTLWIYLEALKIFCCVRIDLSELAFLSTQKPLIVIANHPTILDAVLLLSRCSGMACVIKAKLRRNILFGPAARLAGYISNQNTKTLIDQACGSLRSGLHLLIFPEGGRTQSFPLDSFSKTAALISSRSGIAIQTLLIEFSTPYLGKNWPLFKRPTLPLLVSVKLGKKFDHSHDITDLNEKIEGYYRQNFQPKLTGGLQNDRKR